MSDEYPRHDEAESNGTRSIDPDSLRERADVEFEETTTVHEDRDHFESHGHDVAVVGVTNGAGDVCLFVNEDAAFAGLPWAAVADGDWITGAHSSIEDWCTGEGVDIVVEEPILVRRVEHEVAGEDGVKATTHTILFRAAPVESDPDLSNVTGAEDWTAGWFDGVPNDADQTPPDVAADVRRFV
ncbi:hypothetical protein [Halovivax cerinus]|uniref:NUDIX hydrolase n=1 Tax=Halovivax cerinus TaxID=1487865 RepID=A0ABD5NJJ4_9EURY|nr:hypothetical protein [Halovivax cerinus]